MGGISLKYGDDKRAQDVAIARACGDARELGLVVVDAVVTYCSGGRAGWTIHVDIYTPAKKTKPSHQFACFVNNQIMVIAASKVAKMGAAEPMKTLTQLQSAKIKTAHRLGTEKILRVTIKSEAAAKKAEDSYDPVQGTWYEVSADKKSVTVCAYEDDRAQLDKAVKFLGGR